MGLFKKIKEKLFGKSVAQSEKYVVGLEKSRKNFQDKFKELVARYRNVDDSYFDDVNLISSNLEGALERIDIREDCADFTANTLIRFYLENKHRLKEQNIKEIKNTLINFKYSF